MALNRLAFASIANTAIIPMQDILGLNETARMNTPASVEGNWTWRIKPGELNIFLERLLPKWATWYNRR